jgi:hypothetical protein
LGIRAGGDLVKFYLWYFKGGSHTHATDADSWRFDAMAAIKMGQPDYV